MQRAIPPSSSQSFRTPPAVDAAPRPVVFPAADPSPSGRGLRAAVVGACAAAALAAAVAAAAASPAVAQATADPAVTAPPAGRTAGAVNGQGIPTSFADLAAAKLPAVVTVTAVHNGRGTDPERGGSSGGAAPPGDGGPDPFRGLPDSPLRDFLEDLLRRQMPEAGPPPQQRVQPSLALGSGFIIDPEGDIVTNNHVVEKADKVEVTLNDERKFDAKVVGTDPMTDLALLKIQPDQALPSVQWGDSDAMRVGDWVLAIGNPFGLGGTVTAGIISARARHIGLGPYDDFIQTDAAINRGNSGGPMFNRSGEVIGVNTAIFSQSGGNVGIGFAIPSSMAGPVIAQLRETGHVTRGWLGVGIQPVGPEIASALGLKDRNGALVASVAPQSPAARAGVETGDLVTDLNGKPVATPSDLSAMVARIKPGETATLTVRRGNDTIPLEVRIAELQPAGQRAEARQQPAEGTLGLTLAPITPDLRKQFDLDANTSGAVVVGVAPGSPAAENGFRPGDVITRAGRTPVQGPADVAGAIQQARNDKRDRVLLLRHRKDGALFVPLPVS